MKLKSIVNGVKFAMKKHSPEILMATGMVCVTGATVLSGYQTLKLESILDDHKVMRDKIDENAGTEVRGQIYSEEDAKADRTKLMLRTGVRVCKLYAPVAALEALGLACLACSHSILARRNVALMAAYTAVEEAFTRYRKRIVSDFGAEYDRDVSMGVIREEEPQRVTVTDEDGKEHEEIMSVAVIDPNAVASPYSRFFDESSKHWVKNSAVNLTFLKGVQNMCNDRLLARGYLMLNEVYEMLDIKPTTAGALVGWKVGKGRKNYVDFGIFDMTSAEKRAFVNGYERVILLNFNVDGPVYNLL